MNAGPFVNRADAGACLAALLRETHPDPSTVILALPRGGVPVAAVIASALGLPFDLFVVRKLGYPQAPEVAMGAIASGGAIVLNDPQVDRAVLEAVIQRETAELLRREKLYRHDQPPVSVHGRPVIIVDDGMATGATMRVAVLALRKLGAMHCTVAVPVASESAWSALKRIADTLICPRIPDDFRAVGESYQDFAQTSDAEVQHLLDPAK